MSSCDICDELAAIRAKQAEQDDKLSILLTGVGTLLAAASAAYWNPADKGDWVVLSNGDRDARGQGGASSNSVRSVTSQSAGKWYAEISADGSDFAVGLANGTPVMQNLSFCGEDANSLSYYTGDGNVYENNVGTAYGSTTVLNDIIGLAVDVTNKKFYVSINGTWQNSADPAAGTGGYVYGVTGGVFLCITPGNTTNTSTLSTATGEFTYTPPTGFSAWG